jgi:N-formylglutamate amidohydrolase
MSTEAVVEFVGPWSDQVVATSVHAGHEVRPQVAQEMSLPEADRLREEDPFTDVIASAVPSRMITHRSRFEVDLNRPRREAVYRIPEDAWGLDIWRDEVLPDDV